MEFYSVEKKSNINLSEIEYSIFEWKILNIDTFIDSLEYKDDNLFCFVFVIEKTENRIEKTKLIYHFNVIYNINIEKWVVIFNQDIDETDDTHIKILDMVDIMNSKIDQLSKIRLPADILNIIENQIDDTEF